MIRLEHIRWWDGEIKDVLEQTPYGKHFRGTQKNRIKLGFKDSFWMGLRFSKTSTLFLI